MINQLEERKVNDWNKKFPVGTRVCLRKDRGDGVLTFTRSEASILGDHTAVVWVVGVAGCYALANVTPISEDFTVEASTP